MVRKIFLIIFLIILSCALVNAQDTNWKRVAPNNYIDWDGVVGLEDIYGFSFLLKSFNKGQYEPVNGKPILYTLSQYEIDCAKRKYKIGVIDSYDDYGNFVNGDYNRFAQFQPIISGTAINEIANELCRE